MPARAAAIVLVLLVAGCLAPPEGPAPAADARTDAPRADDVVAFLPNGSLVPSPAPGARVLLFPTGHAGEGGEPTVTVSKSGVLFTNAWDETLRSRDGGATWEVVHSAKVENPLLRMGGVTRSGDPWVHADPVSGRVFVLHLMLPCAVVWTSDDDGDTWARHDGACVTPVNDHPHLATALPGPAPNALAGVRFPTVAYQCINKFALGVRGMWTVQVHCLASYDGGATWPVERVLKTTVEDETQASCDLDHGVPAGAPDGTVVVPISEGCGQLALAVTRDSGLTWTTVRGPEGADVDPQVVDPAAAFAPDGTLYVLWQGADHRKHLARTRDLGASWEGPWDATPPGVRSTDFMTLEAGAEGVAMAFLGSRDTDEYAGRAPPEARWHLFVVGFDHGPGEPVFRAWQATPEDDPVQIGCTNAPPADDSVDEDAPACRNLGDFFGSAILPDGRFVVAFTDGCGDGCAGVADAGPAESRGTETVLAVLDGWTLGAARGPGPTASSRAPHSFLR